MQQLSIGPGPAGTLLVDGDPDNPVPYLIQNVDLLNILYLGNDVSVNSANPRENAPLNPGQSAVADGSQNVFGIASPGQTVAVNIYKGVVSYFQPPSLANLGGASIFTSVTAPTQPPVIPYNSLWFAPDGTIRVWNGSTWVPYQFGNIIEAGTVIAGVVDGTVVKASQFVAQGTVGEFLAYTGTAAHGNLLASISGANGSDAFSNSFLSGIAVYSGKQLINLIGSPAPAVNFFTGGVGEAQFASVYLLLQNAGAANESELMWVKGPASTYDNVYAAIALFSSNKDGSNIGNGNLVTQAGITAFWDYQGIHVNQSLWGAAGVLSVGDSINFTGPGKGPFIGGESFHAVGLPSGLTGSVRIKLLPWNMVWLTGQVTWSNNTAASLTFGAFPTPLSGSSYYPTVNLTRDVGWNGTLSAIGTNPRLFIPAGSGQASLTMPNCTSTGTTIGFDITYPNN